MTFQTADPNPGGARWCFDHPTMPKGRLECTKKRARDAGQCHGAAISGLDACVIHSGTTRVAAVAKGQAQISAWSVRGEVNIDPGTVVLSILQETFMRVAVYGELLRQQVVAEGMEGSFELPSPGTDGKTNGLIGFRYGAAGKEGRIYAQSEDVRALVALEAAERDRAVKYAEAAHKMGISDRLINIAERWGDAVAGRISLMFDALGLTPEQAERVPEVIQMYLSTIDTEAISGVKAIEGRQM